jgi:molybdopterin/thiamine biosynthesis adenylyltransferase
MRPILNVALRQRSGVVLFHAHPHAGQVGLSADDRRSARELLPTFQNLVPDRPHASVVLGNNHAAGLMLLPNDRIYEGAFGIRWLGRALAYFPTPSASVAVTDQTDVFHRQVLLIGEGGQHLLRHARVVVVGLGGGGSAVVQFLAHMGVGEIIGIDDDRAERSNRGRLIGMTWWDTLLWRRRKTAIMARMVRRINPCVRFTPVPKALPASEAVEAVKRGDIVIGCLDTLHARADLQELAWRFVVPYIDIGLLIQPESQGHPFTIGGHIATLMPGEFCQWCIGMLSDEKLQKESGGRPRSYLLGSSAQAQVASMNGTLASQAATEVLQMLTHYAPADPQQTIKKYDGLEGTVQKWAVKQRPACPLCRSTLAAGDAVWRPV